MHYFLNKGGKDKLRADNNKNSWIKSYEHPDINFNMTNDEYMKLIGEDITNTFNNNNYNMSEANLWYNQSYMEDGKDPCNSQDEYDFYKYDNKLKKHWFFSTKIAPTICPVNWEPC